MIQDLRREQEKKADDELDLLRELEDEAEAAKDGKDAKDAKDATHSPKVVVGEDSQVAVGLDRDGFVPSDVEQSFSEDDGQQEGDKPRKPWKKKGLKRQTRRVIMRPVAKKAQTAAEISAAEDYGTVEETQLPREIPSDIEGGSSSEYGDDDDATAESGLKAKQKAKQKAKHKPKHKAPGKESAKKSTRKVKPDAHANYRALKIKNKNSKAKGRGRFGRGR